MRQLITAASLVLAAGTVVACSDGPVAPGGEGPSLSLNTTVACGTTTTVVHELHTGANIGTVDAWNDATDLHIVLNTTSGWSMLETHVQTGTSVSDFPLGQAGNPRVRDYDDVTRHSPVVNTFEYVIDLGGFSPGDDVLISTVALVVMGNTPGYAWGDGPQINPPNLPEYFVHTVQRCAGPPPPPPGTDVVVINDINVFDANAMTNPNNVMLVQNLVDYTTTGPRNTATEIVWDRGRNARCGPVGNNECSDANMAIARSTITNAGFTLVDIASTGGTLDDIFAASGANWKMIWLWTPLEAFTKDEVNALKQFADEGGRVLFIGEWDGYYTPAGIAIENQFLLDMGAVMTNTGGAVDCGYNNLPAASIRAHQITNGLTGLTIACSSVLLPGPNDFELYRNVANTDVLSAVATIDVTPLPARMPAPSVLTPRQPSRSLLSDHLGLNTASSTGQ
ncbi:MAG: ABC transporter [Gemmatimonadota bacterium]|nr:ABC transporter [Gemmatimonadota bacterium]